ncbi:mycofactocin biosynthesis peptidyl-dipeptidase MftE [Streptomyces sp. NBC_01361]|uniref:mycofactocin biosynthesis peptidyl-dipeptidase MftE n=1 Tax=Streptomyces sp. NBC_01361 TaxID=2903838 RepID=UPI002E34FCDD|nr:mycofactocin biosynthesis peptidyl-dipeptidase MftE [Streptomyces sp. NBC_01361]
MKRLVELTWPEVAVIAARSVLVVPLGATEQHGPHLPFTVDTEVAVALGERLAKVRPGAVLAPAVPYGSSGEHAGFPGTLSIGQRATELLIVELGRSADVFAGVLLVSGHGGNAVPLRRAVTVLRSEGRRVCAWSPSGPPEDSHAGRTETSVLLALRPEAVRLTEAEPGAGGALSELLPTLRFDGVAAVSPNGVLGDPTGASRREGLKVLEAWEHDLVATFDRNF